MMWQSVMYEYMEEVSVEEPTGNDVEDNVADSSKEEIADESSANPWTWYLHTMQLKAFHHVKPCQAFHLLKPRQPLIL